MPESKGKEKEKEKKFFEEMMAENFSNLRKESDIHVLEAQGNPNKINSKRSISKHIIIQMVKVMNKRES